MSRGMELGFARDKQTLKLRSYYSYYVILIVEDAYPGTNESLQLELSGVSLHHPSSYHSLKGWSESGHEVILYSFKVQDQSRTYISKNKAKSRG